MFPLIRYFEPLDVNKGLVDLYRQVWYISDISQESLLKYLSNFNTMFVAEIDGKIVGSVTLHLQHKLIRNGGISGLIEDVVVDEKLRGNKIGHNLVQRAIQEAKNKGCYKVILSCFPERVSFYERNGFKKECITMRHNL